MPFCAYCGNEISPLAMACPRCGHPSGSQPVEASRASVLAPWWKRVIAFVIDGIFIAVMTFVVVAVSGVQLRDFASVKADGTTTIDQAALRHDVIVLLVIGWAVAAVYRVPFEGAAGKTFGKLALRLRLVDRDSRQPIGFARALLRLLVYDVFGVFSIAVLVDLAWPLWDPMRQTIHDKAARAVVLDERLRPA